MIRFTLNHNTLKAASLACLKMDSRPTFNGVHVTSDKDGLAVRYEATNGHFVIRAWDWPKKPPSGELDAIIHADTIKAIVSYVKAQKRLLVPLVVTVEGGMIDVKYGDETAVSASLVDGQFPDTDRVIPALDDDRPVPGRVGFNLEYIGTIGKALKLCNGDVAPHAALRLNEYDNAPSIFEARDFLAAIMPCRI